METSAEREISGSYYWETAKEFHFQFEAKSRKGCQGGGNQIYDKIYDNQIISRESDSLYDLNWKEQKTQILR